MIVVVDGRVALVKGRQYRGLMAQESLMNFLLMLSLDLFEESMHNDKRRKMVLTTLVCLPQGSLLVLNQDRRQQVGRDAHIHVHEDHSHALR